MSGLSAWLDYNAPAVREAAPEPSFDDLATTIRAALTERQLRELEQADAIAECEADGLLTREYQNPEAA